MTRLDVGLAAAGVLAALAYVVIGFASDGAGGARVVLAAVVLGVGLLLFARGARGRDARAFPAVTFAFCGAVGLAEQIGSTPVAVALVGSALAAIVTVGLRSLRHS